MMDTNTTTTADNAAQLYGYDVIDSDGNNVGSVDGVWVDDATNALEFVAVKTGFLFGKNHLMPTEQAQVGDGQITVPYTQDQINGGPSFDSDAELSPDDEQSIYSYYGMGRSTAQSPSGYASGGTGDTYNTGTDYTSGTDTGAFTRDTTDTYATDTNTLDTNDQVEVPLSEEQVNVGKRQVQAGQVRIRKVVNTERVEQPVELRREDVEIERIPASETTSTPDNAFQEQTFNVPITEEQPVVEKNTVVTGAARVTKNVDTQTQNVGADVRSEEIDVVEEDDTLDDSKNF